MRRVGDGIESGLQPVREVTGRPFGGQGFDAHLGEGLMMDQDNMDAAALAATLGHDDLVSGRHFPWSSLLALSRGQGTDEDPRGIAVEVPSGWRRVSLSIAAHMKGALAVQEGSDVVDRLHGAPRGARDRGPCRVGPPVGSPVAWPRIRRKRPRCAARGSVRGERGYFGRLHAWQQLTVTTIRFGSALAIIVSPCSK